MFTTLLPLILLSHPNPGMPAAVNFACDLSTFFKETCMSLKKSRTFNFFILFTSSAPSELVLTTPTTTNPSNQSINQSLPCAPYVLSPCSPWKHPLPHKVSHVLSSHCWTSCSPHHLYGQESLMQTLFSHCIFFSAPLWVWEWIFILCYVLSNQLHNSLWFWSLQHRFIHQNSTALWQLGLFPDLNECNAVFFNWWVATQKWLLF